MKLKGKEAAGEIIVEKVARVRKDLAHLDEKLDTVEEKLVEDIENTAARLEENLSNSSERQTEERIKLKELLDENERKLEEVNSNLLHQKDQLKKDIPVIKCDECGKSFSTRKDIRKHVINQHPKQFSYNFCESVFKESWRYETHLEVHMEEKKK